MMEFKIDPEFKSLIPPLTQEEYQSLESSILTEGCRDSLVTWNDFLIDGHNRFEICNKHNLSFRTINQDLPSRSDALIWVIDNQRGRRNINELTNCYLIGKRYNTEKLTNGSHTGSNFGKKLSGNTTASGLSVANDSNKSRSSTIYNEKFTLALEDIEKKTGIQKYEFLLGNIKTTMRDLITLNKLGLDKISRVITKVQEGKEVDLKNGTLKVKREDLDKVIKEEQERKKRDAEELKKKQGEERKKKEEELKKEREAREIELKKQQEEEKVKTEEELKKQQEEEKVKTEEELKKRKANEEELKKQQDELKKKQEEELKKQQDELKKKQEEELKKQQEKQEKDEEERQVLELNNMRYNVILCDPPWKYEFSETKSRDIENQYPTMELNNIKSLEIPADEDTVLFLWATAPKLEQAFEVLKAWGFTYKTCAVWDKEIIGMGYWFRGQHELLLVGTKGNPRVPETGDRVSSVIRERRGVHSKKPACVYEIIEKMIPSCKYLEMFARNTRDNWYSWGNQV